MELCLSLILKLLFISCFLEPFHFKIIHSDILVQRKQDSLLMAVGNTTYSIYVDVDLVQNKTWFSKRRFGESVLFSDKIKGITEITIKNKKYTFNIVKDKWKFREDKIEVDFTFLFLNQELLNSIDIVSFAYKMDDEYSIIQSLYKNHHIDRRSFAITKTEQSYQMSMYFGGIPIEQIGTQKSLKCPVQTNYPTWGCILNQISFSSNKILPKQDIYEYAYFQTNIYPILAPEDFLDYIYETVFYNQFKEKLCFYDQEDNKKIIVCYCNSTSNFPGMYFHFGNGSLYLDNEILFHHYYRDQCSFIIEKNYIDNENDKKWIFGNVFLLLFDNLFDYDNNEITFYSKDKIFDLIKGGFYCNKVIIILNIILLLASNIYLIFILKKIF